MSDEELWEENDANPPTKLAHTNTGPKPVGQYQSFGGENTFRSGGGGAAANYHGGRGKQMSDDEVWEENDVTPPAKVALTNYGPKPVGGFGSGNSYRGGSSNYRGGGRGGGNQPWRDNGNWRNNQGGTPNRGGFNNSSNRGNFHNQRFQRNDGSQFQQRRGGFNQAQQRGNSFDGHRSNEGPWGNNSSSRGGAFDSPRRGGFNNNHQRGNFDSPRNADFNQRRGGFNNNYNNSRPFGASGDFNNQRRNSGQFGGSDFGEHKQSSSMDTSNGSFDRSRSSGGGGSGFLRDYQRDANGGRYSNDHNTEEFYINTPNCSAVIGRGGGVIKEIQSKFNVRINIEKNTPEYMQSLVKVSGPNPTDITAAIDHIKEICTNNEQSKRSSPPPLRFDNPRSPSPPPKKEEEKFEDIPRLPDGSIDYDALNKRSDEAQKARWSKCPPLIKNFYVEHPEVTRMTKDEVERFRKDNMNITATRTFPDKPGGDAPIPNPIVTFEHAFATFPDLLAEIRRAGFKRPSPIQTHAWPILLKGEDLIGIAQTGTGKTLAFLLPALIHIDRQPVGRDERGGPNVLVMAPTRELALQIQQEVEKYQYRGIKAVCLYGGGERNSQIRNVEAGVQIIIATPGRLNDLVQAGVIQIESITYLVLDEADRMLDMGFEPQIRKLLLDIRPDRQTVMTSATWPPGVRRLAASYMSNPIQVFVGSLDLAATHTVKQYVEIVEEDEKFLQILDFIRDMRSTDKVIIFCGKKARADDLASELSLRHINNQSIHGNREQQDREQALQDIKDGTVRILVATDVASRGIDIEDITHVINMDFPRNIEEYVHRVGRTGRAGRSGVAISFVTRGDWMVAQELIDILREAEQDIPPQLYEMAERWKAKQEKMKEEKNSFGLGGGGGGGGGNRDSRKDPNAKSFLVESNRVGIVIGRGGSNVREIQEKFNVKVDIDKHGQPGHPIRVTVRGDGEIEEAVKHIKELLA